MKKAIFIFSLLILVGCGCTDEDMFSELKPPIMVINKEPWKSGITEGNITLQDANGKILKCEKTFGGSEHIGDILYKNFEVGETVDFNKLKK